jgi:hypothetical protein
VSSGAITITEPTLLGTSLPFVQNELCLGACNGFITALPVGGTLPYTYAWDNSQTTTDCNRIVQRNLQRCDN